AETFPRQHPEFLDFWRIHDRLNQRKQDLDDEFGRNILAYHPRMLPLNEQFSEVALNQCRPSTLDNFEHLGRLLSHVANERRLDLVQFALQSGQQLVQSRGKIVRLRPCRFFQFRLDAHELIGKHRLEQIELPRKISIKCFLADPQRLRQVIHSHTAESMTEEVLPGSIDNSLPVRIALSAVRPRLVCPSHIYASAYHNVETNQVYLVSERSRSVFSYLSFLLFPGISFESEAALLSRPHPWRAASSISIKEPGTLQAPRLRSLSGCFVWRYPV